MTILLFIVILLVLVVVHEFGHFLVAKKSGMRVDEFGVGFPPKLFGKKYGETEYTVNALPFGGFVRIFGEDPTETPEESKDTGRRFGDKSFFKQASVIVAGVLMSVVLAWVLFSANFMLGMPGTAESIPEGATLENPQLTAVQVLPESPAEDAGLISGDKFTSLSASGDTTENLENGGFQDFVGAHANEEITVNYTRGEEEMTSTILPTTEIDGEVQENPVIGVSLQTLGTFSLPPHQAIWQGLERTVALTYEITVALGSFFYNAVTGQANFDNVAGPVGIVNLVGDASDLGLVYLLSFVAIISLHLAIINIIPFPALDGGRLLFVIIEAIKGSPISPKVANTVNAAGFFLLIVLMIAVTYHDIIRLISS